MDSKSPIGRLATEPPNYQKLKEPAGPLPESFMELDYSELELRALAGQFEDGQVAAEEAEKTIEAWGKAMRQASNLRKQTIDSGLSLRAVRVLTELSQYRQDFLLKMYRQDFLLKMLQAETPVEVEVAPDPLAWKSGVFANTKVRKKAQWKRETYGRPCK